MASFFTTQFILVAIIGLVILLAAWSLTLPSTGFFVAKPLYDRVLLEDDFELSAVDKELITVSGDVNSSLFKSGTIEKRFAGGEFDRAVLRIISLSGNKQGQVIISLNGLEVYRGYPNASRMDFELDPKLIGENNIIEIKAGGAFLPWEENKYSVSAEVHGLKGKAYIKEFEAKKTGKKSIEIAFEKNFGELKVILNGKTIFEGEPEGSIFLQIPIEKKNKLQLLPASDSLFKIAFLQIA
ncbi:MAG: hypothetical protein HY362_02240 [Candidatus Aenigmarchaeota archaeon]|nr:hypothetical protein [Candidatus Aenigmarchaeota archaeon]